MHKLISENQIQCYILEPMEEAATSIKTNTKQKNKKKKFT